MDIKDYIKKYNLPFEKQTANFSIMKKILIHLSVFLMLLLISCSKKSNGDKHIGIWWIEQEQYINVKKAGEKGYFLTLTIYKGGDKYTYYCEYKDGCYHVINKENEKPIFCESGNKMIDSNGNFYIKVTKILN